MKQLAPFCLLVLLACADRGPRIYTVVYCGYPLNPSGFACPGGVSATFRPDCSLSLREAQRIAERADREGMPGWRDLVKVSDLPKWVFEEPWKRYRPQPDTVDFSERVGVDSAYLSESLNLGPVEPKDPAKRSWWSVRTLYLPKLNRVQPKPTMQGD
jgi:hypothetical protein